MKIIDRLYRLLGRRSKAKIESESERFVDAEIHVNADGHVEHLADFSASLLHHTVDPDEDTPLHAATRNGDSILVDTLNRVDAKLGKLNLDGQTPADLAVSESHLLVTIDLPSSDKAHREVTSEEVAVELMKYPTLRDGAAKNCGFSSQATSQENDRAKETDTICDTSPNVSVGETNANTTPNHSMAQPVGQPSIRAAKITYSNCTACYEIQREFIPESGREMQCSVCGHVWFQVLESKDDLHSLRAGNIDQPHEVASVSAILYSSSVNTYISPRVSDLQSHLAPSEIRLIIEARHESLHEFVVSSRLHGTDPKGDTPLHLAARVGNLALCDLFIRSGADPRAMNHERQTPADVALAEGHRFAAQLLSSFVANSPEPGSVEVHDESPELETVADRIDAILEDRVAALKPTAPDNADWAIPKRRAETPWTEELVGLPVQLRTTYAPTTVDDLDELLSFDAVEEPEEFFDQSTSETASGTFSALVSPSPSVSDDQEGDWELDLSSARIAGEGIGSGTTVTADHGAEHDFLKVRNRGPKSVKRAVVQTGTRLFIDPEICITWAEKTLANGWCSVEAIETLIELCEGNGDPEELRINLWRNLEAAGINVIDETSEHDVGLWDARSDISSSELAEAIEVALTRATRLPGTQRFVMEWSDELQLLEPMVRAKQELLLGILASEAAVEFVLANAGNILDGFRDFKGTTGRDISLSIPYNHDTADFYAASYALKHWAETGADSHGKQRREALAALDALDLSIPFHKELIYKLHQDPARIEHAIRLDAQIVVFEAAIERLIREHLPCARRFAARNVEDGEDPEDVFQVAFMGLQQATRRFDPERGYRFLIYATYWMRQAIVRWRADEGTSIRVPVHRSEKVAKLDRALDRLDVRVGCTVSDDDLAAELEWTVNEVRQFRTIPREAEYPESTDNWENLLPEQENTNVFDQAETKRIVTDALAELPGRQADVIRMRFGIGRDEEMTLEEIGQLYGVTRERIRQIEAKGLDQLSHAGRKRRLQTLLGM